MAERKVALVTGASYGIGRACAVGLARDGYDVVVTDLSAAMLDDTRARIAAAGSRAQGLSLDVRSQDSVERAMADAIAEFGRVDVLVNNAGVPLKRSALEMTRAEWEDVLSVNVTGAFFMSQQVGRHLVAVKRTGAIVSIASTFALIGIADRMAYGVSKAAVAHMTKMLAIEWAGYGIRVNAVAPGSTDTEGRQSLGDPERRKQVISKIPLGRLARPEEIADAVCYLAGPAATFVTGHTLVVDGGTTID